MASYGIFRVEKLKKISNLRGSLMHAFREQITPNADSSRRADNVLLTPDAYDVKSTLDKYEALKPTGKIRADVVHAIEVMVTASPEAMKAMSASEREAYLKKSLDFCNSQFGTNNLLHAQIHNDETTAHLTAFYIPVIEKENKKGVVNRKLNASEILGGKKDYSERQTAFYEQVSKHYGLERGEIGSKAEHKKVLDWYSEINAEKISASVPKILEEVEKKAKTSLTYEVEESKVSAFGYSFGSEKVKKELRLSVPVVSVGDIKNALTPYQNSNSEMKRRERNEMKQQARKELEAEVKAKFAIKEAELSGREAKLEEREENARSVVANVNKFYGVIADKLGVDIQGKEIPDIQETIIKQAKENGNKAREAQALIEFKKKVDNEVFSWTDGINGGMRAFSNFDEYRAKFRQVIGSNQELYSENKSLSNELNKVKNELFELRNLKSAISDLVNDFFDGTLEKTVGKLVNFVKGFSDPKLIKEKYEEQCDILIAKNQATIESELRRSLNGQNNYYNDRLRAFDFANKKMIEIYEYTNGRVPEKLLEIHKEAREKIERDKHLNTLPKMRM